MDDECSGEEVFVYFRVLIRYSELEFSFTETGPIPGLVSCSLG
jgi:hypothetical protein